MRTRLAAALILGSGLASAGCLTSGVVDLAQGQVNSRWVHIEQVKAAAVREEQLYLQLDVRPMKSKEARTVVLRIPFDRIGTKSDDEASVQCAGMTLEQPTVGFFEPDGRVPPDAEPLPIERKVFQNYWDQLIFLWSLQGVHVLQAKVLDDQNKKAVADEWSVESDSPIVIVRGDPDQVHRRSELSFFSQSPKKHPAWYLMTPLSAVGDVITSPVQLIAFLRGPPKLQIRRGHRQSVDP